jgi:quercetin dioxygenase-like cupin family protein
LFFEHGKRCSWHYHKQKDETFYLQSGRILLYYGDNDSLSSAKDLIINPGDKFHVYRGLRHQMIGIEDSELFEFSTQHFEDDSYRVIKGD